jgi:hypothetical protein
MERENPARKQPTESGKIRNRDKRETPIRRSVRRELLLPRSRCFDNRDQWQSNERKRGEKGSTWPGCSVLSDDCHVSVFQGEYRQGR